VLFVRELADGKDLVFAFASDGSPAWALDRESGLQWWYLEGDSHDVRLAISEQWPTFETMPVAHRATYSAPHPAVELARRTRRPVRAVSSRRVEPSRARETAAPWVGAREAWERLPLAARFALVVALTVAALVVVTLLGSVLGGGGAASGDSGDDTAAVQRADSHCSVRGLVAHDTEGHVLVCAATSRALPTDLVWRSTT
jgi:hypothetical protein